MTEFLELPDTQHISSEAKELGPRPQIALHSRVICKFGLPLFAVGLLRSLGGPSMRRPSKESVRHRRPASSSNVLSQDARKQHPIHPQPDRKNDKFQAAEIEQSFVTVKGKKAARTLLKASKARPGKHSRSTPKGGRVRDENLSSRSTKSRHHSNKINKPSTPSASKKARRPDVHHPVYDELNARVASGALAAIQQSLREAEGVHSTFQDSSLNSAREGHRGLPTATPQTSSRGPPGLSAGRGERNKASGVDHPSRGGSSGSSSRDSVSSLRASLRRLLKGSPYEETLRPYMWHHVAVAPWQLAKPEEDDEED